MSLLRRALRVAQQAVPRAGRGGTVLAYHLVGAGTASPVDLPALTFRRQMKELAGGAEVVPLREMVDRLRAGRVGPRPLVTLTFDDAYRNFAEVAWPVLRELGLPASLFVPVGFVEGVSPPPLAGAELPPISWDGLAELADGGVEIGSHTWSHAELPGLSDAEIDGELRRSRDRLEERLGRPVESFCYPRALWNRRTEERVGRVYRRAVVGGGRRIGPRGLRPLRISRIPVRNDGPVPIAPMVSCPVWLDEWAADLARRGLRGLSRPRSGARA